MSVTIGDKFNPFRVTLLEQKEYEANKKMFADAIEAEFVRGNHVATMPATIFVNYYDATVKRTGDRSATVQVEIEPSDAYKDLYTYYVSKYGQQDTDEMMLEKSKLAISPSWLRANELARKRKKKVAEAGLEDTFSKYKEMRDEIRGRYMSHVASWRKKMVREGPHLQAYADEHWGSSVIPGLKWPELVKDPQLVDQMFQSECEAYDFFIDHQEDCRYSSGRRFMIHPMTYYHGGRSRSEPIKNFLSKVTFDLEWTRMRMTEYGVGSRLWAFIPEAHDCFVALSNDLEKILGVPIITPAVQGGQAYVQVRKKMDDGCVMLTLDGSGHESHVPWVLDLTGLQATLYDDGMEPSGSALTTPGNHAASAFYCYVQQQETGIDVDSYAMHADDINPLVKASETKRFIEWPDILEYDPFAFKHKWYMGYFMKDKTFIHPGGNKVSTDNAYHITAMHNEGGNIWQAHIVPNYTEIQTTVILNFFKGQTPEGKPMIEVLGAIPPGVFKGYGPSDAQVGIIDEMVLRSSLPESERSSVAGGQVDVSEDDTSGNEV